MSTDTNTDSKVSDNKIPIETPEEQDLLDATQLKRLAIMKGKAQAVAATKWLTLIVNNYCMDQKGEDHMEVAKKYSDLYVEFNELQETN